MGFAGSVPNLAEANPALSKLGGSGMKTAQHSPLKKLDFLVELADRTQRALDSRFRAI